MPLSFFLSFFHFADIFPFFFFFADFVNEKLQKHFTEQIFDLETKVYESEGIDFKEVAYIDNKDVLDLIETSRTSLFRLLNEETMVPRGSSGGFFRKAMSKNKGHPRLEQVKHKRDSFILVHYAGNVLYQTDGFMEKNKDRVFADLTKLMLQSGDEICQSLFRVENDKAQKLSSQTVSRARRTLTGTTIAAKFCVSLNSLMKTLRAANPHFVRCIKTNGVKSPGVFDAPLVLEQLVYSGVFEAVIIRQSGFPFRRVHKSWLERYVCLSTSYAEIEGLAYKPKNYLDLTNPRVSYRDRCAQLISILSVPLPDVKLCRLGRTMVLHRAMQFKVLELARHQTLTKAAVIAQRIIRGGCARKRVEGIRKVVHLVRDLVRDRPRDFQYVTELIERAVQLRWPFEGLKEGIAWESLLKREHECAKTLMSILTGDVMNSSVFSRLRGAFSLAEELLKEDPEAAKHELGAALAEARKQKERVEVLMEGKIMLERGVRDSDEEALVSALKKSALMRKHFGDAIVDRGIAALKKVQAVNESAVPPLRDCLGSCPFTAAHGMRIHQHSQDASKVAEICRDLIPGLSALDSGVKAAEDHFKNAGAKASAEVVKLLRTIRGIRALRSALIDGNWESVGKHLALATMMCNDSNFKTVSGAFAASTRGRVLTRDVQAARDTTPACYPFFAKEAKAEFGAIQSSYDAQVLSPRLLREVRSGITLLSESVGALPRQCHMLETEALKGFIVSTSNFDVQNAGVKQMIQEAKLLVKVRDALKVHDWDLVEKLLGEVPSEIRMSEFSAEIRAANEELNFQRVTSMLEDAIGSGERRVRGSVGALDCSSASSSILNAAIKDAMGYPAIVNIPKCKMLLRMANELSRLRSAVIAGDPAKVERVVDNYLEWKQSFTGGKSDKAYEFRMMWPTSVVRTEIEIIIDDANNKRVVKMLSVHDALGSKDAGGTGPLGGLDKSSICVSALSSAQAAAADVLASTRTVLEQTERYVESAKVALELRIALKGDEWESAENLLTKAGYISDGVSPASPSYNYVSTVDAELESAAERVLNRRAYLMMESSMILGGAKGAVGRLDCTRVSTASLEAGVAFSESLSRRSERTEAALAVSRALIQLRSAQSVDGVDYENMREALQLAPISENASFVGIDASARSTLKSEVSLARSEVRNHDGLLSLATRLGEGSAEGVVGALDLTLIDFRALQKASESVSEWSGSAALSQSPELLSLNELAKSIISVRKALAGGEWASLASALAIAEEKRIFTTKVDSRRPSVSAAAEGGNADNHFSRARRASITRGSVGGKVPSAGDNLLLRPAEIDPNLSVDPAMRTAREAYDGGILELGVAFAEMENHNVIEWLSGALAKGTPEHTEREPLNCTTLVTEHLYTAIQKANSVRSKLTARSSAMMHCANVISKLRDRLIREAWPAAEKLVSDELDGGFEKVTGIAYPSDCGKPLVAGQCFPLWEIGVSDRHLKDIRLRASLLDSMNSGWPNGPPGDCDLTALTIDLLVASCTLAKDLGVTTTLADNMIRTANLLIELRTAWGDKNYNEMQSVMQRADAEREHGRLERASDAEFFKAKEDMEERMLRIALRDDGLAIGQVTGNPGYLDRSAISCDGLKIALALSKKTPPRSDLSRQLEVTARCILDVREAFLEEDWTALDDAIETCKDESLHPTSHPELQCSVHHLGDHKAKVSMIAALTSGEAGKGDGVGHRDMACLDVSVIVASISNAETISASKLSPAGHALLGVCRLLLNVRMALKSAEWERLNTALRSIVASIHNHKLIELMQGLRVLDEDDGISMTLVSAEVNRALESELHMCIAEYMDWKMLGKLKHSLSIGHSSGKLDAAEPVGEMEVSTSKIESLDEALGEANACSTGHSVETKHSILLATSLRRYLLAVKGREVKQAYEQLEKLQGYLKELPASNVFSMSPFVQGIYREHFALLCEAIHADLHDDLTNAARSGRISGSAGSMVYPTDIEAGIEKLNGSIKYATGQLEYAEVQREPFIENRMKQDAVLLQLLDACVLLSAVRQAALARDWNSLSGEVTVASKDSRLHRVVFDEVALCLIQAHEMICTSMLLKAFTSGRATRGKESLDEPLLISKLSTGALDSTLSKVQSSTRLAVLSERMPTGEMYSRRFLAVNECAAAIIDLRHSVLSDRWYGEPEDEEAEVRAEDVTKEVFSSLLYARRAVDALKRNSLAKISEAAAGMEVAHTDEQMIQEAEAVIAMDEDIATLSHEREIRYLSKHVIEALLEGSASGRPGKLDVSTIRTSNLRDATKNAAALKGTVPKYMRVAVSISRRVLAMREALSNPSAPQWEDLRREMRSWDQICMSEGVVEDFHQLRSLSPALDDEIVLYKTSLSYCDIANACSKALQEKEGRISNDVVRKLLYEGSENSSFVVGSLNVTILDEVLHFAESQGELDESVQRVVRAASYVRNARMAVNCNDMKLLRKALEDAKSTDANLVRDSVRDADVSLPPTYSFSTSTFGQMLLAAMLAASEELQAAMTLLRNYQACAELVSSLQVGDIKDTMDDESRGGVRTDLLDVSLANAHSMLGNAIKSPRLALLMHSNKVAKKLRMAYLSSDWSEVDALVQENFRASLEVVVADSVKRELEIVARISVDRRAVEGLVEILSTPLDFQLAVEYDAMRFVVGEETKNAPTDNGRSPSPLSMGMGSPVMFVRHRRNSTAMSAGTLPQMRALKPGRSGRSSAVSTASALSISGAGMPTHGGLDFNFDAVRKALNGIKALIANAEANLPGSTIDGCAVTKRTQLLLSVTEMVVGLRRAAFQQEWDAAGSILKQVSMMEDTVQEAEQELAAARKASDEHTLLQRLVDALQSGVAGGKPGELRLHTVSWDELDAVLSDQEMLYPEGKETDMLYRSRYLSVLLTTAKHLKSLRVAMLAAEWNTGVKEALTAIHVDCVNVGGVPAVALPEIEKVSAELVNREAERRLEVALSRGHAVIGRFADSSANEDAALDDDHNTASAAELHSAINHANGLRVVAPRVKKLLNVARSVVRLRTACQKSDWRMVGKILNELKLLRSESKLPWLSSSSGESAELERVEREYENHVAIDTLKRELRRGGAYRSEVHVQLKSSEEGKGDLEVSVQQHLPSSYLDLSRLSIAGLNSAIQYAVHKRCTSEEVQLLLKAARVVRALRSSLLADDWLGVRVALNRFDESRDLNPVKKFVEREVYAVRRDLYNRELQASLLQEAFSANAVKGSVGALEIEDVSVRTIDFALDLANQLREKLGKSLAFKQLTAASTEVDIFESSTLWLLKTAMLVRKLREAVIRDDWSTIATILSGVNVLRDVAPCARAEVNLLRHEVEDRTHCVLLKNALLSHSLQARPSGDIIALQSCTEDLFTVLGYLRKSRCRGLLSKHMQRIASMVLELRNAYLSYDYKAAREHVQEFYSKYPRGLRGTLSGQDSAEMAWQVSVDEEFSAASRDLKHRNVRQRLEDAVDLMAAKGTTMLERQDSKFGRSGSLPVPSDSDILFTKEAIAYAESVQTGDDGYLQDLLSAAHALLVIRTMRRKVASSRRQSRAVWSEVNAVMNDIAASNELSGGKVLTDKILRMYPSAAAELSDLQMLQANHRSTVVLLEALEKAHARSVANIKTTVRAIGGKSLATAWFEQNQAADDSLRTSVDYALSAGITSPDAKVALFAARVVLEVRNAWREWWKTRNLTNGAHIIRGSADEARMLAMIELYSDYLHPQIVEIDPLNNAKVSYFVLGNIVYDLCVGSVPFFSATREHIWSLLEGTWDALPSGVKSLLEELVSGGGDDGLN